MSRSWIIGIVCLAVSASSMLSGWAQEGPSQKNVGLSLSERLSALTDTFRRDKPSKSKQRYAPQTNSQKNRSYSSQPSTTPSQFGRTQTNASNSGQRYPSAATQRVGSIQRVGAASDQAANARQRRQAAARKGSASLDFALSDLLAPEAEPKTQPKTESAQAIASDNPDESNPKANTAQANVTTPQTDSAKKSYFDVHQALVGEDEEDTAADQPESDADAIAIESKEVVSQGEPEAANENQVIENKFFTKRAETPSAVEEPQTSITKLPPTAEEQPSPTEYPKTKHRAVIENTGDPFDESAEKVFSANSMRGKAASQPARSKSSFQSLPTAEQTAPTQRSEPSYKDVMHSYEQPVIVSHVEGPRTIMVGREASYRVTLENTSGIDAVNISAAVRVPEWAEVVEVISTGGVVKRRESGAAGNLLEWQLRELAAKSSATLRMRLIPRSGRPLQLGVQWSQAPMNSEMVVEVQEPKLEVSLSGPQEVLYGQPQRYRLTLRNPGTGVADDVEVQLIPPGGDAQSATNQSIGALQPGEVKEMELELTAHEAGELIMRASAVADGGLSAETVKSVLCRKPELTIDWRGPDTKYTGTVSAYYIRVQNPGTATTEPVTVTFELPEGAQFVSASDGHSLDTASETVSWRLVGLSAGEEQFMQVRCQLDRPGINRFNVSAQVDSGKLTDSKTIETKIVALADLKLEVIDPQGPLPLGDLALYEIRVRNRGTAAAKGVSVIGLFSAGINPVSIEGAQYTERDGRVTFHPIKSLSAGEEVVLRIRAKSSQVGTHIFRAEVICPDLDIKLAAEEATRFYKDEFRWEDSQTPYSAEKGETINR